MQTKEVTIENKKYTVNQDEFCKIEHKEYNNLRILDKVGELERVFSLICEIRCVHEDIKNLFIEKSDYGGFVPINCSPSFEKIFLLDYTENAKKNVENHKVKNISKLSVFKNVNLDILYLNDEDQVS